MPDQPSRCTSSFQSFQTQKMAFKLTHGLLAIVCSHLLCALPQSPPHCPSCDSPAPVGLGSVIWPTDGLTHGLVYLGLRVLISPVRSSRRHPRMFLFRASSAIHTSIAHSVFRSTLSQRPSLPPTPSLVLVRFLLRNFSRCSWPSAE